MMYLPCQDQPIDVIVLTFSLWLIRKILEDLKQTGQLTGWREVNVTSRVRNDIRRELRSREKTREQTCRKQRERERERETACGSFAAGALHLSSATGYNRSR